MHKRSGVPRKSVVSPVEPCTGGVLSRESSPSQHKHWAWVTTKVHFRLECGLVTSALYESRDTCRLHSKRSERLATARDGECAALRAAILSGIPNVRIALFLQCSVSARDILVAVHSRRQRDSARARGHSGQHFSLRQFCTSAWPGWDLQSQSLIVVGEKVRRERRWISAGVDTEPSLLAGYYGTLVHWYT